MYKYIGKYCVINVYGCEYVTFYQGDDGESLVTRYYSDSMSNVFGHRWGDDVTGKIKVINNDELLELYGKQIVLLKCRRRTLNV